MNLTPPSHPAPASPRSRGWILKSVLLLAFIAAAVLMVRRGWSYYVLALEERVDHPDFRTLRPSGFVGNGYGVAGTLLILTNLLYLARRRLCALQKLGSMKAWLDVHAFTGLLGALFVSFHSAFQLRSTLAICTAVSLAIVVLTGVIGRSLHVLAPRAGGKTTAETVAAIDAMIPGIGRALTFVLENHPPPALPFNASLARVLFAVPGWRRVVRLRREAIDLIVANAVHSSRWERPLRRRLQRAVREAQDAAAFEVRQTSWGALLGAWRSLHRLFAIFMLGSVGVHIAVAWHYGYRWIFGG